MAGTPRTASENDPAAPAMPEAPRPLRLFVALLLEESHRRELNRLQLRLKKYLTDPDLRWRRADQIHLTLKFLGCVPAADLPQLTAALDRARAGIPPLALRIARLDCFPSRNRPRVVWAGIEGDLAALKRLQSQVETQTAPFAQKEEKREFQPHLTLARIKHPSGWPPETRRRFDAEDFSALPWPVSEFALMRSHLAPSGARYEALARFPLSLEP